jgi:hypothetical protein
VVEHHRQSETRGFLGDTSSGAQSNVHTLLHGHKLLLRTALGKEAAGLLRMGDFKASDFGTSLGTCGTSVQKDQCFFESKYIRKLNSFPNPTMVHLLFCASFFTKAVSLLSSKKWT